MWPKHGTKFIENRFSLNHRIAAPRQGDHRADYRLISLALNRSTYLTWLTVAPLERGRPPDAPCGSRLQTLGILAGHGPVKIAAKPVRAPLPDVSGHIVTPATVRGKLRAGAIPRYPSSGPLKPGQLPC